MNGEKRRRHGRSIRRRLLVPICLLLTVQVAVLIGGVYFSGLLERMDENAYAVLDQRVQSRAGYLEDDMVRRWSNLSLTQEVLGELYEGLVQDGSVTPGELASDPAQYNAFLEQAAPELVSLMRTNSVTGAFVVLNTQTFPQELSESLQLPGLYLRDRDPSAHTSAGNGDLLLERAPGREAYPGDVFYLHSRLLERSAHLSDKLGGGSMTALPIVETQAGDVSAYIPTNIISITDGQIFLESDLFFAGQRPAVNVGLSVSRVGGAAQTKATKKATGSLRLDLAQYREMEVFTQFSSDLDDSTKEQLHYGQGLMRILRQKQYHPLSMHQQVIVLVCAMGHVLSKVAVKDVTDFRDVLLDHFEQEHSDLCRSLEDEKVLTDDMKQEILRIAEEYLAANAERFRKE